MLFLIIIIYFIITFMELLPLYMKKQKKEFIAHIMLLSVALILSILISFGVRLPSASRAIAKIVKFMLGK